MISIYSFQNKFPIFQGIVLCNSVQFSSSSIAAGRKYSKAYQKQFAGAAAFQKSLKKFLISMIVAI
jgi:hypothetical protein